jgi:hypothetical protein
MTNYEKQATDFLNKTNTTFKAEFLKNDFYFQDDKEKRDIYKITLTRENRTMSFNFGNSIVNSGFYVQQGRHRVDLPREALELSDLAIASPYHKSRIKFPQLRDVLKGWTYGDKIHRPQAPTPYGVLACLQKYDCGTFEDFCAEFGYDEDSKTAEKIYNACLKEFADVQKMWNDAEIEELQEIQ